MTMVHARNCFGCHGFAIVARDTASCWTAEVVQHCPMVVLLSLLVDIELRLVLFAKNLEMGGGNSELLKARRELA